MNIKMSSQPMQKVHSKNTHIDRMFARFAMMIVLSLFCTASFANPQPSFSIKDINAPHPKHCLDERQWKEMASATPFNLFVDQAYKAWQLCAFAVKDSGYTLNIELAKPMEIDAFSIKRASATEELKAPKKKRNRKKKTKLARHSIEEMQILFYDHSISTQYPVYFQKVKFEAKDEVNITYDAMLNWNPILLSEPMFDERRRALKLSPIGMNPPIKVDQIGLVFPRFDASQAPPALHSLKFYLKGQELKVTGLEQSQKAYTDVMSQVYNIMIKGFMLIGETRTMFFADTGTLWAMEGEEEVAKVIGAWRFNQQRIEVDLSASQKARIYTKRKARIEKSRDRHYKALHLLIDEAPDRIIIQSGSLQGEYQSARPPSATEPSKLSDQEQAPSFEIQ